MENLDVDAMLASLRKELARTDAAIRALLELNGTPPDTLLPAVPLKRRGRKSMSEEEREAVSVRMRTYWQRQRDARGDNMDTVMTVGN